MLVRVLGKKRRQRRVEHRVDEDDRADEEEQAFLARRQRSAPSPADRFEALVANEFGTLEGGAKVAAIGEWIARHVAYLPGERIVGLSKLARVVESFARSLQVQERLTTQVADWLERELAPQGRRQTT